MAASSLLLAACSALPWFSGKSGNGDNDNAGEKITQPAAAMAAAQTASSPASSLAAPPPAPDAVVARMLTYAERVRLMPPAELSQEAARLSAPSEATLPGSQLQLSLVLSQLRQLPELIRAQELLARVLANASPDAQPLHPLARLLAFRYGEQRRLEDQIEKERQQTREVQRKLDQTNERLEALKAIERSLTARPPAPPAPAQVPAPAPAPASAPASRGRAAPP
jgi:hypothetical protein